ncbi:hypothetical protein [Pandoraea apista]|uniref:hypothetical protein n=1 Tax=Pandoraea apista TaxID=93218 RepID=UPI000F65BD70|nr:hypothetical protein [Pandoraea apista]RRW91043.1 hypothetical protein EGJ54_21625 [Pandoraea apista]RRX00834.1 hypothetical protein EGJ56_18285 [Pandoraea apista]
MTATPVAKCTGVILLSRSDYEAQQALSEPLDRTQAGAIWWLAFGSVLTLYFVSRSAGALLEMIRRG